MRIASIEYSSSNQSDWKFSRVELSNLNLLVGDSSTGKTRFLNTIFNLARFAIGKNKDIGLGLCKMELKINDCSYFWEFETHVNSNKLAVKKEFVTLCKNNFENKLVERTQGSLKFKDAQMPKLSTEESCISLFKEEEDIKPLYDGFSHMLRRRFFGDDLDKFSSFEAISPEIISDYREDLTQLFSLELNINTLLYAISRNFSSIFSSIRSDFIEVFPFVTDITIKDLKELNPRIKLPGFIPTVCIKEKDVNRWIPSAELSSGMQKVLLIITDAYSLPDGSIYLIDEYENSLGISAIDFFPTLLVNISSKMQYFITSHHPYLINKIPPENWLIFHRKGSHVTIRSGKENKEIFSKSKQERFIQLINDPFYTKGM